MKKTSQEFRLKNIEKIKNFFIKEINQNELMSKKPKNICTVLNYIEHLLVLASVVIGCVSISAFAFLVGITKGSTRSLVGLKICAINAIIKKNRSIIKKKTQSMINSITSKTNLNTIDVLISKALIHSYIRHNEFLLVNNALGENYDMNKESKI